VTTLWDTTGTDVVKALAAERRSAGALAFGLVLTLIAVTDEKHVAEAEAAATAAASAHPCRLLIVVRRQILDAEQPRLDAEVLIGGRLGPGESVVMRMYGRLALHAESVVLPLLAPDAPVVTWWHGEAPEKIAYDPLGVLADRRVTDSAVAVDQMAALRMRAEDYAPGDTDLAWPRITSWRGLLAAAFDTTQERPTAGRVLASAASPSAALLSGWLGSRLDVPVEIENVQSDGIREVQIDFDNAAPLRVRRRDSRSATISREGRQDRVMPLGERDLGDLLAEELRRLDADQPYAEALGRWSGFEGLSARNPARSHVWRDPAQERAAEATA
jgi:glucose-6-phosphate dehydrogenase assembly protein OpcA